MSEKRQDCMGNEASDKFVFVANGYMMLATRVVASLLRTHEKMLLDVAVHGGTLTAEWGVFIGRPIPCSLVSCKTGHRINSTMIVESCTVVDDSNDATQSEIVMRFVGEVECEASK